MRQHLRMLWGTRSGEQEKSHPTAYGLVITTENARVLSAVVKSSGCGIGEMWVRSGLIQLCEIGQLIKFLPVKNRNFKST